VGAGYDYHMHNGHAKFKRSLVSLLWLVNALVLSLKTVLYLHFRVTVSDDSGWMRYEVLIRRRGVMAGIGAARAIALNVTQ
jgi:hypothetical protein